METLVEDPSTDLHAKIPHGDGQTILREALLIADHNAYHLGVLAVMARIAKAVPDRNNSQLSEIISTEFLHAKSLESSRQSQPVWSIKCSEQAV